MASWGGGFCPSTSILYWPPWFNTRSALTVRLVTRQSPLARPLDMSQRAGRDDRRRAPAAAALDWSPTARPLGGGTKPSGYVLALACSQNDSESAAATDTPLEITAVLCYERPSSSPLAVAAKTGGDARSIQTSVHPRRDETRRDDLAQRYSAPWVDHFFSSFVDKHRLK